MNRLRRVRRSWFALAVFCAQPLSAAADDVEYPLDSVSRDAPQGDFDCDTEHLEDYSGTTLRYHRALRVHPAFRERLERFEEVVRDVAVEIYGRAPRRIRHLGSFQCRRIRAYPDMLSEHALGNALDVSGFDFGPQQEGDTLPEGVSRSLRRGFRVRMLDHWTVAESGRRGVHRRFLRTVARRLIARANIFNVLLGPAWPGHHNHFHFDCAPYRLVKIFEEETDD